MEGKSNIDLTKWKQVFIAEFSKGGKFVGKSDLKWTEKIKRVIHEKVTKKLNYEHQCICTLEESAFRKEYMSIDMTWTDDNEFQIPDLIIEIEDDDDKEYIAYCFWKLWCHKSKLKILIAFPSNPEEVIKYLRENIPLEKTEEVLILFGEKYIGNFREYPFKI